MSKMPMSDENKKNFRLIASAKNNNLMIKNICSHCELSDIFDE